METIIQNYQPADYDENSWTVKYGCPDEPEK